MKYGTAQVTTAALLVAMLAAGSPSLSAAAETANPLGRKVEDFELRDYQGKPYKLSDMADKQAVVIVFLGTECPLATLYAPRLNQLAEKFAAQNVALVGINSNQQDSLLDIETYVKTHKLSFPVLKDLKNVVADQMGAVRTPEAFVLDQDRAIRYWGRIDDQYVVGRKREGATRNDLVLAVESLLAGKPIEVATTEAPGCHIGRIHAPRADSKVTYSKDIAAVLNKNCVGCHRKGEIGPFQLTSYEEVAGWSETIAEVVRDGRMPPWHANPEHGTFRNDCRLTEPEKQMIYDWVAAGAPEGNPADLPEPPKYADGWRLPRVDQEIFMSDKAYQVPAEGTVDYVYYRVDPGFTEDKWVQGAQCKAGNGAVVHHIIVFIDTPRGGTKRKALGNGLTRGFLAATAPGATPMLFDDGMAKLVPAGSKLVFQMHYTPNGSPQEDLSSIGLMFADPKTVKHEVSTMAAENNLLTIPPRMADYKSSGWHTFREDTILLSMFPHMHVRGKSFRYKVRYPDGKEEILLDVPHYDFNWQATYELAEPKLLPKGTRMQAEAHFDNSADNIANPNPDAFVTFGEQTWEEMLIGFMECMPAPTSENPAKAPAELSRREKTAGSSAGGQ